MLEEMDLWIPKLAKITTTRESVLLIFDLRDFAKNLARISALQQTDENPTNNEGGNEEEEGTVPTTTPLALMSSPARPIRSTRGKKATADVEIIEVEEIVNKAPTISVKRGPPSRDKRIPEETVVRGEEHFPIKVRHLLILH